MVSLHLCTSDSWGGLELYTSTLITELNLSGHTAIALCKKDSALERFLRSKGVRCEFFRSDSKLSPGSIRKLRELIHSTGARVVHVHFHSDIWPASLAVRTNRTVKLMMSLYMGVSAKNDLFHRFIYNRVDSFFTSSRRLLALLPSLYPVPAGRFHFLPYGRRVEKYVVRQEQRAAIRSSLKVKDHEILVGTMVRIDPGKGVMDFVRSYPELGEPLQQQVKYVVVGEPTRRARAKAGESPFEEHCEAYRQQLEAFVVDRGLEKNILLVGFQEENIAYLGAMDIFVFPSRDELYSLVMLDAMSMGLPVVAARAGGNLEQIREEEDGLMYTVGDSLDLGRQLARYVADPQLRHRHGAAARRFVESNHGMTSTITQLLEYYSS